MLIGSPLSFITEFVEKLNEINRTSGCECQLTSAQKYRLSFCIMAVIMTNSVCWAKFERALLKQLWQDKYRKNMQRLIPDMAKELGAGYLYAAGVKISTD